MVCVVPGTGLVYFSNSATSCNGSTQTIKHDIASLPADKGLSAILGLKPVSFQYNGSTDPNLGFIAEEVSPLFPELTYYDSNGKIAGLNYEALTSPIVLSIQQLNTNVNNAGLTINTVSSKVTSLESLTDSSLATLTTNTATLAEVSVLIGDVSPKKNPDGTDNGLSTLVADIQKENPRDPVALIAKKITDDTRFLTDFVSARITAIRGYFDEVFAKKVHTEQLCVKKSDGNEVCVSGDQMDSILKNTNVNTPTPTVTPTPIAGTPTPTDILIISPSPTQTASQSAGTP